MTHTEIVSFLWSVADLIRDSFKRGKYSDVILPLTVLRRLDCVLAKTKPTVLKRQAKLQKRGLQNLDPQLRAASGLSFYNTSRYDFEKLVADAQQLAANLRNYLIGFSPNRASPPRPLAEIESDIRAVEADILQMLEEQPAFAVDGTR